jgi:predicted DNA-binding protein
MDIRISIPAEMQNKLQQRALDCGQEVAEYVERLIEKDLGAPMSLRDLYAPVVRQIEQAESRKMS